MRVTVVTYHYVRDLERSRFPNIRALTVDELRIQLDYLQRTYTLIDAAALCDALDGAALPPDAAMLTFDDGYIDHYVNVLPILHARRMPAIFFPVASAAAHARVLDVNKIHFILASADAAELRVAVDESVRSVGGDPRTTWAEFEPISRYDDRTTGYVKQMLQAGLPEPTRSETLDRLFSRHVSADERAFAAELYASEEQLRVMASCGMDLGGHGVSHRRFELLSQDQQDEELRGTVAFLSRLGVDVDRWVLSYPYGGHDDRACRRVADFGCAAAFTTRVGEIEDDDDRYRLPRLNTNDFPRSADDERVLSAS